MKRKLADPLPLPARLAQTIGQLQRDAEQIPAMYARLHDLGGVGARGDSVHVSGGGQQDPTGQMAIESARALHYREYAEGIAKDVAKAAEILFRVQQSLERNVGPGPGFRQPHTQGSDALVTLQQLSESITNQERRLGSGVE